MRVAINGFGRIGRAVFRIAEQREGIDIVAINDLYDDDMLAYLLTYDTVMGHFEGGVEITNGELVTPHGRARMVSEGRSLPAALGRTRSGCGGGVHGRLPQARADCEAP